jgi:hypothetical protein
VISYSLPVGLPFEPLVWEVTTGRARFGDDTAESLLQRGGIAASGETEEGVTNESEDRSIGFEMRDSIGCETVSGWYVIPELDLPTASMFK